MFVLFLLQDNETYYSMEIIKDAVDDYWIEIIGKGKQLNNDTGIYPVSFTHTADKFGPI